MNFPKICWSDWNPPILGQRVLVLTHVCNRMYAACLPAAWHFFLPLPHSTFSFSSSITHCYGFHHGKCQCAHLPTPLAWPAQSLCNVQTLARAKKAMERWGSRREERGEGRINQDAPPTTAAGRLARHGEIICFPILGCWTLVTPAVSVKPGWSCKTHSLSSRRGAAKGRATTSQLAPTGCGAVTPKDVTLREYSN